MQEFLNKAPFARICLPLMLGIAASILFRINSALHWYILITYGLLTLAFFYLKYKGRSNFKWIFGLILNCFFFFVGVESCYLRKAGNSDRHYTRFMTGGEQNYYGFISDIPQEKSKSIKCKLSLFGSGSHTSVNVVNGDIVLYFKKNLSSLKLKYGDLISFTSELEPIKAPTNPGEFDYRKYLSYKNIFHQAYIDSGKFRYEGSYVSNLLFDFAVNLRVSLLNTLKENGLAGNEYAIAAALLLGYDDEISSDLMQAYSHTGTLHVLSVSGLHVGILFLVLNFFLRFPKRKYFNLLKTLLIFGVLWFYALLSGLSPSVVRSTIMFSFVLIGTMIGRKGQIYNTLFGSAFIMLLYDPFLLIDAGFQLSYLAVGGIVFFYPYVERWYLPANRFSELIWKMFAVSLSAQIITLPITLYYFHQFPLLFFVANLVVIPLSYAIMAGAFLVIVFYKIKVVAGFVVLLVSWSAKIMNGFTEWLDGIKFSNISGINTGIMEMVILFCLIVLLTHGLINRNFRSIMSSITLCIFLTISSIYNYAETLHQKKLIVYNFKGQTCINLIDGFNSIVLADSLDERSSLNVDQYAGSLNAVKKQRINLSNGIYEIAYAGNNIMIINGDTLKKYNIKTSFEYLLVSKNPRISGIEEVKANKYIADGSNNNKTIGFLKKCLNNDPNNTLWITKEHGAYILDNFAE